MTTSLTKIDQHQRFHLCQHMILDAAIIPRCNPPKIEDPPPDYDLYFDDGDLEVSTSMHVKETIQESDAHQVFDASPKGVLLDMEEFMERNSIQQDSRESRMRRGNNGHDIRLAETAGVRQQWSRLGCGFATSSMTTVVAVVAIG
uniref:Uncharacterized protein n=1 Tax=Fagus sylvatica TaxID=28930 RepID=A0A2N9J2F3_FAGSY